jgi:membrane-associated phospholipid phosphatase
MNNRQFYLPRIFVRLLLIALQVTAIVPVAKASGDPEPASSNQSQYFEAQLIRDELTSPLKTDARNWLIGGTTLTAALVLLKEEVVDPIQRDFSENKPLGRLSVLGDYGGRFIPNLIYSGTMFWAYKVTKDSSYLEFSLIMMKASVYAVATSTLLKVTIQEPRPNDRNDTKSFPSGHTTAAFAFSSVVAAEHGFFPCGLMATALSTLTGLSRINDNKHYLHDVVAGATIGTVFGLGVSSVNKSRASKSREQSENSIPRWQIAPALTKDFVGLFLSYELG